MNKFKKWLNLINCYQFSPVTVETYGEKNFFTRRVYRESVEWRSTSFLIQSISIAVQNSNAAPLMGTLRNSGPLEESHWYPRNLLNYNFTNAWYFKHFHPSDSPQRSKETSQEPPDHVCNEKQNVQICISTTRSNRDLTSSTQRSGLSPSNRTKLTATMVFPIEGLDMSKYAANKLALCRYKPLRNIKKNFLHSYCRHHGRNQQGLSKL